jgi:hypothetical protein
MDARSDFEMNVLSCLGHELQATIGHGAPAALHLQTGNGHVTAEELGDLAVPSPTAICCALWLPQMTAS